jgi:hypothetical protein
MNKEPLLLDFKNAVSRFAEVMLKPHASDLEKAGCIQYADALKVYEKLGSYVSPLQQLCKNLDNAV